MQDNFTIVVMSTDRYSDTWHPFFKLFSTYWPDCRLRIVLNTETKDYDFPGLNIRCARVGYPKRKHPTWGQCMIKILSEIDTEIILYLDCDYFLSGPVDIQQIEEFVDIMSNTSWSHQDCVHIGLTHAGTNSPFHLTEFPLLWEINHTARYMFCLQAGLWKRDSLMDYIRSTDSNWDFEESSHVKGRRITGRLLTVNRHIFNPDGRLIIPYTHTGIIKGKWNRDAVEDLFAQHGILVDFSIRGFYSRDIYKNLGKTKARLIDKVNWKFRNTIHRLNTVIDRVRSI